MRIKLRECGAFVLRIIGIIFKVLLGLFAIYRLLAWPPVHWFYDVASHAGPNTIYIPGGGFSGFWFHLGYLQSRSDLNEYEYYCFSSACLGILAVLMNHTSDDIMDAALLSQERWQGNQISRFELVHDFLETLVPIDESSSYEKEQQLQQAMSKIQIMVTTGENGVEILQATNRDELLDLMIKTTWVPALTGWGFLTDQNDIYLDGGFSRYIHPECEYYLELPVVWETLVHTFTPSLTRETIRELWDAGYKYEYGFEKSSKREVGMLTEKEQPSYALQTEEQDASHIDTNANHNYTRPICSPSDTVVSLQSSKCM